MQTSSRGRFNSSNADFGNVWLISAGNWLIRTIAAASLAFLLAACSSAPDMPMTDANPAQVALFGDSLAWEAQPYYSDLIKKAGDVVHTYDTYGGTAVCDWLQRMREVESQYHPGAVELEFSGNNLTPCMKGHELYSASYYEKYRADTLAAVEIFAPHGAHVNLIGAPITRAQQSTPGWQKLNQQYEHIASSDPRHVTYVDAGSAVESSDRTYTETLPCLPEEPCTGPVVDGVASNIVRSNDGTHFCPTEQGDQAGVIGGCSVYSSGASRYARAMADAVINRS
jgi:hypothetical protein